METHLTLVSLPGWTLILVAGCLLMLVGAAALWFWARISEAEDSEE